MKYCLYIAITLTLLSGCAKVSQDQPPCTNTPAVIHIPDTIVAKGKSIELYTYGAGQNTQVKWTRPDGQTETTTYLQVYVGSSTDYGVYKYQAITPVCTGAVDSMHILPNHPGNPTCTINLADTNKLTLSDGSVMRIGYTYSSTTGFYVCADDYEIRSGVYNMAYFLNIGTVAEPIAGGYYELSSTCPAVDDQAHVSITDNARNTIYYSVSGRMYCNLINGQKFLTFCNVIFQRTATSAPVTVSGNVAVY